MAQDLSEKVKLWIIEFRYPDDFYIPDKDEARSAFHLAMTVKDFVIERIVV